MVFYCWIAVGYFVSRSAATMVCCLVGVALVV